MIKQIDIVRAAVDIYDPASSWDEVFNVAGVYLGLRRIGDDDLLIGRGSDNVPDWLRDFDVFGFDGLTRLPKLGPLHCGMAAGLPEVYAQAAPKLRTSVYCGGHSLGASHIGGIAGMLTGDGRPPQGVVVMGEPKIGMQPLVDLVAKVQWLSLCNRHSALSRLPVQDPVTCVPFTVPPILEFRHPRALTFMDVDPSSGLPTALHSSALYLTAAEKFL